MKNALIIGIDAYPSAPLNGCVNDATRISALLKSPASGFDVRSLIDSQATRSKIRKEIEWCLSGATFSVIYFAGHGVRTTVATFLATFDYEEGDEGIDLGWLQAAIARLSSATQTCVLILDCCHSGDATVRSLSLRSRQLLPSDFPSIGGAGRALLAACRGDQVADEVPIDGNEAGVFTHHLCDALEGFAADQQGAVTVTASYDYIALQMKGPSEQTPVFKGDLEGQIVLASGVSKKGAWQPKTGSFALSPKEAAAQAENLLSQVLQRTSPQSHSHWQQHGYREACQAFEPVLDWFRRRVDSQPDLRTSPVFREQYESSQEIFKSLGNVMPGIQLLQGRVGNRLGAGTFGTVYQMESVAPTNPACIKVYHAHDLFDAQKVGRFRRGYAAMKQLDHPKIVKVRELSEIPLGFFMDYIEGANSRQFNPAAVSEPEAVVRLLLEVAETLQHAHGRGVLHRDVKPENILIGIAEDGQPSAYLTDFDLSWFSSATQVTKVSEGFGSHFYAAPEQINTPNAAVAHRSTVDVYSFGQLCFFFVAGRDPLAFNPDGNARTLEQELSRRWTDSAAASEMLRLYKDCTQQVPTNRISDFREICERLAQMSLVLEAPEATYETGTFVGQVRFTLSGEVVNSLQDANFTSFRSRSRRTDVSIRVVKDAANSLGIDVTFRPDDIVMEGRTSQEARIRVNARVDTVLQEYFKVYEAKRSGAKSGAFEMTVRIDHLKKERKGVAIAREIISRVLDQIEHT